MLSNDATAIALTPIVYEAVSKVAAGDVKPFLFACIFVANAASFGLPFSNPTNVLILPHARLLPYVWHLGPPQLAAIAATLAVLLFFFRRELRGRFEPVALQAPNPRAARTLVALVFVAAAYVVALLIGWPLGIVASLAALLIVVVSRTDPMSAALRISWKTLVLLIGLFVLFDAVMRAGFANWVLAELDRTLRHGALAAEAIAAGGAALLSNALNNLPIAVAASSIVARLNTEQLAYPLIVGVAVGPNLLTSGSLATILWLAIVRGCGVRVSLAEYMRLGIIVVPVTIAIAVAWLWIIT